MVFSSENTLDALVDHLRTDWILSVVAAGVEIGMHLGHDQHSFEVLNFFVFVSFDNCALNVGPDIWSIVSIEINDLFFIGVIV